jgi:hypothetical protein
MHYRTRHMKQRKIFALPSMATFIGEIPGIRRTLLNVSFFWGNGIYQMINDPFGTVLGVKNVKKDGKMANSALLKCA